MSKRESTEVGKDHIARDLSEIVVDVENATMSDQIAKEVEAAMKQKAGSKGRAAGARTGLLGRQLRAMSLLLQQHTQSLQQYLRQKKSRTKAKKKPTPMNL